MLRGKGIEVLGFIDAAHASAGFIHVDLVNATRLLSKPPVSRERQFQKFKQQGTVDAIVTANRKTVIRQCENENKTGFATQIATKSI
jgi:hypothetical protein